MPARRCFAPFRRSELASAAAAAPCLGLYLATLAPSIALGDSSELTTAAAVAGVAHPTGYPLYTMLGWLMVHLIPIGSPAYRVNLLSALAAAATVWVLTRLAARLLRSPSAGWCAGIVFGLSRTFWSQAVVAEVYTLHVLLALLTLESAFRASEGRRDWKGTALRWGLAFTHHLSSVLLTPALLLLGGFGSRRRELIRALPRCAAAFGAPLLLYAYLPLAALRNPAANWGDPINPANFLAHVTGRQYRVRMLEDGAEGVWRQWLAFILPPGESGPGHLWIQAPMAAPLIAAAGWLLWRRRRPLWAWATAALWIATVAWASCYRIPDIDAYYLMAHAMLAIWVGAGLREASVRLSRRSRTVRRLGIPVAGLALALLTASGNIAALQTADPWTTHTYALAALDLLPRDSLLIGGGDNAFSPLVYAQAVEGHRPDVTLLGYYDLITPARVRRLERLTARGIPVTIPPDYHQLPPGRTWKMDLLRQVLQQEVGRRPVFLLGEPVRLIRGSAMRSALAGFDTRVVSNVPALEVVRSPAAPDPAIAPPPGVGAPVVRFRSSGGAPVADLLSVTSETFVRSGMPWVRLTYRWRVPDAGAASGLLVRALFADAEGNVEAGESGVPEFNNIHALGNAFAVGERTLPKEFSERFELYVPASDWGRPRRLWLGLASAGGLLASESGERFVPVLDMEPAAPLRRP